MRSDSSCIVPHPSPQQKAAVVKQYGANAVVYNQLYIIHERGELANLGPAAQSHWIALARYNFFSVLTVQIFS